MMSARLLFVSLYCGIAAAAVGGFMAMLLLGVTTEGPEQILGILLLALLGAIYAVPVAAMPAMILGMLLLRLRMANAGIWSLVGALAGLGCLALGRYFPGHIGDLVAAIEQPATWPSAAFAVAGAIAALSFRMLARSFDDDGAGAPASGG